MIMNEDERQAFHLLLGIAVIALLQSLGIETTAYLVGAVLVLGLLAVHLRHSGISICVLDAFIARFERPGVMAGYGAMTYAAATLAILTLLANKEQMIASMIVLGVGDAASTVIGRRSKRKLPYNRRKTYGGSAAFFLCSLPSVYFAGLAAVPVCALAAIAESLESNIDDNLIVAVVCVVAFRLLG
ncbi:Uncharacterised protein [uncultured archaeon]|nr:Uncharacterised protein [uncultured archaeon]